MTTPAAQAPPGASDKLDAGLLKIAGVVVLGAIMSILDTTVVSVALPTFQTVFDVAKALGKTPAAIKDSAGFAVNRLLLPLINEAFFVLQEGIADAKTILLLWHLKLYGLG